MNLVIPGEPVPKQRPRRNKSGHFYTPRETVEYESRVAWVARCGHERFEDGPVVVTADFYVSSHKGKDLDNLVKSLLDGLQLSGCIGNDSQVVEIHAYLFRDEEAPRAEVLVERAENA